ncbi:MAG: DUF1552 domain-containing protein [Bryobacteraceae bacterium]
MFIAKRSLPRRTFLKGLGVSMALPMFDAMIPAQTATPEAIRRFGAVFVPLGARMDHWTPSKTGSGFEFTDLLKPAEAHRDSLVVVSNLFRPPHGAHSGSSTWLTGANIKETEAEDVRAGISLDQVIAEKIGGDTQFRSLEVAIEDVAGYIGACDVGYSCTYINTISWKTPTTPLPMEVNPRVLFERLFGGSGTPQERLARRRQNASILDSIRDDAKDLERGLGPRDQSRLNEYLDDVREIEQRIQKAEKQNAVSVEEPNQPVGIPQSYEEHLTLMYDMLKIALQTDMTRVFTFMLAREVSQKNFPELGLMDPWHHMSHHRMQPEMIAGLITIQTYQMKMFSRFLDKLKQTPDGDGSLLDHSVILFGSGMSESDNHDPKNLPLLVAGKGVNLVQGNRHLMHTPTQPLANAWLTLGNRFGVEMDTFAASTGRIDL